MRYTQGQKPKFTPRFGKAGDSTVDPRALIRAVGNRITDALDPVKAPSKVKKYTSEEIAALNQKMREQK